MLRHNTKSSKKTWHSFKLGYLNSVFGFPKGQGFEISYLNFHELLQHKQTPKELYNGHLDVFWNKV